MARTSFFTIAALYAFVYAVLVSSAPVQYCPISDVCYQVAVPEVSAAKDGGNIYLQLRAPISYSWVAFGTGDAMRDSSIFVMYQDGNGNVTISARTGTGHTMPRYNSIVQLELLDGSGLLNSEQTMVANVRCGNCGTWPGGFMSLDDNAAPWIAAWKTGDAINSADPDAQIQYHDAHDTWAFDLTTATVTDDANPFVDAQQFDNNNRGVGSGSFADPRILILSHGIIMAVVMIVLYPLGSALMPVFGKWAIHAAWQLFAFLIMWAGFGLGIVALQRIQLDYNSTHTILGTVVVGLLGFQPMLGWFHHKYFMKNQTRGLVSHAHIWYGRALIIAGIVNGGLGLELAGASRTFMVVYTVFAVLIFILYVGAALFGEWRRRRHGGYEQKNS
ncbi:CBD9-like protein [Daldinia decipiens]|uniref:CBD9-like protein n=1 Tax=Daldinia decipiens TaxID=326647 RepID=UPI0020C22673|nr:CBD9-like protein [Daldinia decipiens]KAI1661054.1 CBD9-like protein [Daldinia decipiens]